MGLNFPREVRNLPTLPSRYCVPPSVHSSPACAHPISPLATIALSSTWNEGHVLQVWRRYTGGPTEGYGGTEQNS